MSADLFWCHNCDKPLEGWALFIVHANAGHAITYGGCRGVCQFPAVTP